MTDRIIQDCHHGEVSKITTCDANILCGHCLKSQLLHLQPALCYWSKKVAEDGTRAWDPATYTGGSEEDPGSWLSEEWNNGWKILSVSSSIYNSELNKQREREREIIHLRNLFHQTW